MTFIKYRCEHHPCNGTALAGFPVRAEVPRLRGDAVHGFSASRIPRTIARPASPRSTLQESSAPEAPSSVPECVPAASADPGKGALDGLRILIVEDDDDARELVGLILFNAGALVQSAASAADGFQVIKESHPQVLVSDIGMPYEDGYSLMRRIRALQCCNGGDMPAIALSAFTRPEDRMLALRAGFTVHIAKPVSPSDLVSAVSALAVLLGHRPHQAPPR